MWLISGTSLTVFLFFEQLAFVCHSVALILCVISSCLNICIYAIEVLCTLSILHIFFSFIFLFFFFSYLITWLCSCRFFFPSFISPTQTLFLSLQLSPPPRVPCSALPALTVVHEKLFLTFSTSLLHHCPLVVFCLAWELPTVSLMVRYSQRVECLEADCSAWLK